MMKKEKAAPGGDPSGAFLSAFHIRSAASPRPFFRCGTHRAPGIVNDVVRDFVSILVGF